MFWAILALSVISLFSAFAIRVITRHYEESNNEISKYLDDPISRIRFGGTGLELADHRADDHRDCQRGGDRSVQSLGQATLAGFDRSSPEYKAAERCVREAAGIKHCPVDENKAGRTRLRSRKHLGTA